MNTSQIMSGCCWFPLMNPITRRPEVEKTMIELERQTVVKETRSAFQTAMQQKFIAEVHRLTGRNVLTFISNHHVGPDLEVGLFVLAPAA